MKTWGNVHPRYLSRQHLLGEHNELHICLSGGWSNHPESKRFAYSGGRKFLILRHELLRMEMDQRWPGRHTIWTHPTHVDVNFDDIAWLDYVLGLAWHASFKLFPFVMDSIGFPKTKLKYDTPWDKYKISAEEYLTASEIGLPMKALEG